jgi:hypothetical protein
LLLLLADSCYSVGHRGKYGSDSMEYELNAAGVLSCINSRGDRQEDVIKRDGMLHINEHYGLCSIDELST